MAILLPKKTITIESFIDSSTAVAISYESLSLLNLIKEDNVSIPVFNVLDDYIEEVKAKSMVCELSEEEYLKFYQAPKLLCNHLYDNTELDFIILRINGIYDPKDFTMRSLRLISKVDMEALLSQIYNANRKFINEYNERNNKE